MENLPVEQTPTPFEQLDYLYTPSSNVAEDMKYFTQVLGARAVFAIEGMGARVAMIELAEGAPRILLTDHLSDERPVLIFRVKNLEESMDELAERGWKRERTLEIPQGPCCSFTTPGNQRIAIYELSRPAVGSHFEGRFDF